MRAVLDDPEIRIWARRVEAAEELAGEVGATVAPSADAALFGAEVVCTATSAKAPVVERRWLGPGTHVNAVGAFGPGRELDTDTVARAAFFVDRRESALNEGGDYGAAAEEGAIGPDHIQAELGEVLVGSHPGRRSEDELTVFKSYGIAVEDLAAAELVVRRAREQGVGVEVEF
jgi:ornithine cyclodeaminase